MYGPKKEEKPKEKEKLLDWGKSFKLHPVFFPYSGKTPTVFQIQMSSSLLGKEQTPSAQKRCVINESAFTQYLASTLSLPL